jgi:hypothetical protein
MEPVTLDFFKSYARLAGNAEDSVIEVIIQAAREKSESYTNQDYVSKIKTSSYPANQNCPIPAADILTVSGFYTSKTNLTDAQRYFEEYRKGIITNRDYPILWDNIPTYTITYNVTVNPSDVPASAKIAIAKIASDLYENRETSSDLTNKSLSISHRVLLDPLRKITNV